MCSSPLVFVFGSNEAGIHGAGAALHARRHYGAVWRQGEGLQGQSYAIPTKGPTLRTLSLERIAFYVGRFLDFARRNPQRAFLVTRVGCGLAGYSDEDIGPLFKGAPVNVHFFKEAGSPCWEHWR